MDAIREGCRHGKKVKAQSRKQGERVNKQSQKQGHEVRTNDMQHGLKSFHGRQKVSIGVTLKPYE